jgi:hypothetical protein
LVKKGVSFLVVVALSWICASWAASLAAPNSNASKLEEDCRRSAEELRERLGAECRLIVRPPFVLAGDFDEKELAHCHRDLVQPGVRAMQASYFDARPTEAVTVLLFRDAGSYERYSQQLFGQGRLSPYGYYKPNRRTVIVNRALGDGTLLHELTHALIDFDFSEIPTWLNEGLASLHEACRFRQSEQGPWLEGMINWRLPALQAVIRQGRLRPIADLIMEPDFRGRLEGANYAQARYLCMYLQERGLLAEYYRAFREHRLDDPRGLKTLEEVLGPVGWRSIDRDFQRWTLELGE